MTTTQPQSSPGAHIPRWRDRYDAMPMFSQEKHADEEIELLRQALATQLDHLTVPASTGCLRLDPQPGLAYAYDDRGRRVFDAGTTPFSPEQSRAHAVRLVASFNALRAVPTELLLVLPPDALWKALQYFGRELVTHEDTKELGYWQDGVFHPLGDDDIPVNKLRALIAAATAPATP